MVTDKEAKHFKYPPGEGKLSKEAHAVKLSARRDGAVGEPASGGGRGARAENRNRILKKGGSQRESKTRTVRDGMRDKETGGTGVKCEVRGTVSDSRARLAGWENKAGFKHTVMEPYGLHFHA